MIGYGKLVLDGYGERPESAVLRTDMETGPPKQAMLRSRVMVKRNITMLYTKSEYQSFLTWFRDTTARGANFFFWTDPRDGVSKLARIINGEYEARSYVATEGADLSWEVSLQLETWEG